MSIDKHQQLKDRTKMFALRVIKMSDVLPSTRAANVIANQELRSATSMAASYRAAGRARSKAEFVAKVGVVSGSDLLGEANQLMLIFSAARKTAKS